jgi:hypothetical protein
MEEAERLKARQALVTGALGDKLKLLSKLLVRSLCHQSCEGHHAVIAFGFEFGKSQAHNMSRARAKRPLLPAVWCLSAAVCACMCCVAACLRRNLVLASLSLVTS